MSALTPWLAGYLAGLSTVVAAVVLVQLVRRALRRWRGQPYDDAPAIPWCFTCGYDAEAVAGLPARVVMCGTCYTAQGGTYGEVTVMEAGLQRLADDPCDDGDPDLADALQGTATPQQLADLRRSLPCECPGPATVDADGSSCLRCGMDAGAKR